MLMLSKSSSSAQKARGVRTLRASDDLPNLDFLRAAAVLLVLFGHLTYFHGLTALGPLHIYQMGNLGVELFFVHTCFVLMLSLERQWKWQGGPVLFVSFVIRRIFRIYPLSMSIVLLVVTLRLPLAEIEPWHFLGAAPHLGRIVSNLLLVQSIEEGPSILGPMWSLPYEMAMYPLLPCLFLILYQTKSVLRVAVLWSASILAALVLLSYPGYARHNIFLQFIPCFLPGVIAYQLQRVKRPQLPAFLWPGIVMLSILVFLSTYNPVSLSMRWWIKSWSVCLVLGIAVPFFSQISAWWLVVPSHLIAKYSYGIYLTHFFCIWFVFEYLPSFLPRMARVGLFAVLVTGLPVCFYHFLEEPMVLLGKRIAKRFESITA
jgi:peptidoglycan/LPS O-acetylase OafA/YrhL